VGGSIVTELTDTSLFCNIEWLAVFFLGGEVRVNLTVNVRKGENFSRNDREEK